MSTDTQRFLNQFAACTAFLRGVSGIDSYHCMSSVFSFGTQDVYELTPTSIINAFREMVIVDHVVDLQILNNDRSIVFT